MKSLMDLSELESSVQISITSKARSDNKHGYWGDLLGPVSCGSLLWTLEREYLSPENEAKANENCNNALKYLKEYGRVKDLKVSVTRFGRKMNISVSMDGGVQDVSL